MDEFPNLACCCSGFDYLQLWDPVSRNLEDGSGRCGYRGRYLVVGYGVIDIVCSMRGLMLIAAKKQRGSGCSVEAAWAHNYEIYARRKLMCGMEVN